MTKKILFIVPNVPYPLTAGGNQAFFNMVDYLRSKMSVSVLLAPDIKEMGNVESLRKIWRDVEFFLFTEDVVEPEIKHPSYYRCLKKIAASVARKMNRQLLTHDKGEDKHPALSDSVFRPFPGKYADYVSAIARNGFDMIQVEFYPLISLGYLLPEDVQTIFVHHELRYVRNENEMKCLDNVTDEERLLYRIGKDFERSALRQYKHVIVLTETDRELLADFTGKTENIHVSPAVVRITDGGGRQVIPASFRLTFVGSENHYPNLDAVSWFCREIAPCLRNKGYKFVFQVIGSWESKYARELQSSCPEMELAGYIEDLHSYLNGSIALVPIRIGSGMRMKILDAVSSKTPFVTTAKGVEGIDFRHGEECLKAETTSEFASAIIRLFGDGDLQVKLANQAMERLQGLYNPHEMLERRLAIYDNLTKQSYSKS